MPGLKIRASGEILCFFFKVAKRLLSEEEIRQVQVALSIHPNLGKVIPRSGGLRKLRWGTRDRGKSGGLRIIYYWISTDHQIYLLYVYKKNEQEDLTLKEALYLKSLMED